MKEILFIILFWISTIGYCLYIKKKYNMINELVLPFVFILISLFIFICGMLNVLIIGSIFCLVFGIINFVLIIKRDYGNIILKIKKPNINIIIIFSLLLYVTIVFNNIHFLHYDNFSHWATIVKSMILNNSLPNFEATAIEFKAYQPGTACFIYYFTHFIGLKEGMMVVAQNYLVISLLTSLLSFSKGKLLRLLIIVVIFYVWTINILPTDLLVDTVLTTVLIYIFVLYFNYKNDTSKLLYFIIPVALFLCLVKNSGFILIFIICCVNFFLSILHKETIKGLKNSIIIGLSCVLLLILWSAHVKFGYGQIGLSSHHALTFNNIFGHIRMVGIDKIIDFIKLYIHHFLDIKNNFGNIVMLIVNLLLLSMILIFKKKRDKRYFSVLLIVIDIMYLMYYIALGIMYICSMEEDGLFVLASFDRYLFTIIGALTVLLIIGFIAYKNSNCVIVRTYSILFIVLCLCFTIFYNKKDFKFNLSYPMFIGKIDYESTNSYKFDYYLKNKYINLNNNEPFYVYSNNNDNNNGYLFYLSRYKFNHGNMNVISSISEINEYTDKSLFFELKKDKDFENYMNKIGFCEKSERIYLKCEKSGDEFDAV